MGKLSVLAVCIVFFLLPALLLSACCHKPQPTNDTRAGGVIIVHPYTTGPDTMMQFTMGPDTMGAAPETLWIAKRDCTLTIKYTDILPAGPDTMMVGPQVRVVAKRLTAAPQVKR